MRHHLAAAGLLAAACSLPTSPATDGPPDVERLRAQIAERKQQNREREARTGLHRAPAAVPGGPDEARLWRLARWRDEHGVFDPASVELARQQRDANAAFHDGLDNAGIGRFGWVERGPSNIGGRTRSLVINPANANEMWAGAVGGGVWRSTNAGTSWTPVNDQMGNLAVCSLALVPGTPVTIYAGTGEGFYNGDAVVGNGVYKSVDGGLTFTRLTTTASWSYVNRLAVSPTNPNVVLAATRSPGGIQRSVDGGGSWSLVRSATACMQVLFDPNDAAKCVADVYESSVHRVVHSTNGGLTWTNAATGLVSQSGTSGRIELAYARSVPGMVYASCGTGGGHIWRSSDGGANWTQQSTGTGTGAAWYYNTLWVDPTDANFLVTGAYHLWKSTNGGMTLTQISNGYINTSAPHPDQHQVVADPGFNGTSNLRVYSTNDGGVYTTSNIRTASTSSGWSRRDQQYRASQFYGAAGDGASGRITGGTQDNGHLTLGSGSNTAALTYGGDGGFAAIDWQNPNYLYGEYVYAQVHRSTNGGTSASYIDGGITEAGSAGNFIAPILLDPNNPLRLLVGAASLWQTTNARAGTVAWTAIKPSIGSSVSAIAVAPGNPDLVWVGHNGGQVYKTSNGTAAAPTWTAVDDNGATNPLPNRYVQRIVIDRSDSQVVFIGLGGFSGDKLRKTSNGGTSWVDLTGSGVTGLPSTPVNGIAQHPQLTDRLYVGTDVGIFASDDGGTTWSTSNDGPADVSVDEVVFLHGSTTLLAATHGRGLWTIAIREPVVAALGPGCAGTNGVPLLTATPPRLGQSVTFTASNLRLNQFGLFVLGLSSTVWSGIPLPAPLALLGMPGCTAFCSVDQTTAVLATTGTIQMALPLPTATTALGFTFHAQVLGFDPGVNAFGAVVSNALSLTVGN
ncbi:MAG: hypothetical protein WAT39_17775 [Planctomycetota bacterium]